jgi:hypothetical protein
MRSNGGRETGVIYSEYQISGVVVETSLPRQPHKNSRACISPRLSAKS